MGRIQNLFNIPEFNKPRDLRQLWLKDVGYDEAPYLERMGLTELNDFLSSLSDRIDMVKIVTNQIMYSPEKWIKEKLSIYKKYNIQPYLDHTYFMSAYKNSNVVKAIEAAAELGFEVIEFMSTFGDVSEKQWNTWRKIAKENNFKIIFEFHPQHNWNPKLPIKASTAEEIIQAADPFFNDGAIKMMIDSDQFDALGNQSDYEINKLIKEYSLEKLVFEVESPKNGRDKWHKHLNQYFNKFSPDCNVSNIMPSQVTIVEALRGGSGWTYTFDKRED